MHSTDAISMETETEMQKYQSEEVCWALNVLKWTKMVEQYRHWISTLTFPKKKKQITQLNSNASLYERIYV